MYESQAIKYILENVILTGKIFFKYIFQIFNNTFSMVDQKAIAKEIFILDQFILFLLIILIYHLLDQIANFCHKF